MNYRKLPDLHLLLCLVPLLFFLGLPVTTSAQSVLPAQRATLIARTNAEIPTSPIDVYGPDLSTLDTTSLIITGPPLHGSLSYEIDSVTRQPTRKLIYTPDLKYSGIDTFQYQVCTKSLPQSCQTGYVAVTVIPRCVADNDTTRIDTPVIITVLANDKGSWNLSLVSVVVAPKSGKVTAELNKSGNKTGRLVYTPNPGFTGNDEFTYRACDNTAPSACDQALVSIIISPRLMPDSATTTAGTPTLPIKVLANDLGTLVAKTVRVATAPAHGGTKVDTTGAIVYTPASGYSGADHFRYRACDINGLCADTVVFVKVYPKAIADTLTLKAGETGSRVVTANDLGLIRVASLKITRQAVRGQTRVDSLTGTIYYQPAAGFSGRDSLLYSVCDKSSFCTTATLYLNTDIRALPDTASTTLNTATIVNELLNDLGQLNKSAVKIITAPVSGTAAVKADGSIIYTPKAGFIGQDRLIYQVCDIDRTMPCDTAHITLFVSLPLADLTLKKTGTLLPAGYLADYVLTLNNAGPASAVMVQLLDSLPAGSILVPGSLTTVSSGVLKFNDTLRQISFSRSALGTDTTVILNYQLRFSSSGTYKNIATVHAASADKNLANNTATSTITIELPPVKIPNVFTPNGDGFNDNLVITGLEAYPDNQVQIFDRWGGMVYQLTGYGKDNIWWNGAGAGEGTYFLVLKLNEGGVYKTLSRYITLLRHK